MGCCVFVKVSFVDNFVEICKINNEFVEWFNIGWFKLEEKFLE